jgi:hypothetical protein
MQLPRGTFREIKKNEKTGDILKELERCRFSGICSISYGDNLITLVMKAGKTVLAASGTKKGDEALEELHALSERNVDAALSILDDAQLQLSLEFNKAERITRIGRNLPVPQKPAHKLAHTIHPEESEKPVPPQKQPMRIKAAEQLSTPSPGSTKIPSHPDQPAVKKPEKQELPIREAKKSMPAEYVALINEGSAQTSFEMDIDMFNTMDLDHVTEKIRNDCKTMVKQLHLEHLMEQD